MTDSAVDDYLGQVARAMREGGSSRPEIDPAIDSLREQIFEMAGEAPTARRLEDIVATLEPPAAYRPPRPAGAGIEPEPGRTPVSATRLGWLSVVLAIGSWVFAFALEDTEEGGFLAVLCLVTGLAAGIAGWRSPLGRFGALGSALFLLLLLLIPVFESS